VQLDVFVVRDQAKQPGSGVPLACEAAAAVIQFLCPEAELRSATLRDQERGRCNVERDPPVRGESVQGDRPGIRC